MKKVRFAQLMPLFALLLFGGALWILYRTLREFHFQDILQQLHLLTITQIVGALLLTALSYLVMTGYDGLAILYLQRPLKPGKVVLTSFISYAFSNNIGLSLLAAGSVRYRLYSTWGLSAGEITKIVTFTTVTFWLGIFAVGGLVFLLEPLPLPALKFLPISSVRPLGLGFVALILGYLLLVGVRRAPFQVRRWQFSLPTPRLAVAQILLGAIDWLLAGSILYLLLPQTAHISFFHLIGIFVLAQVISLISHIPGGLGIFESLVLLIVKDVPLDALAGALLVFRGMYYLLPLIVGIILLAVIEYFQQHSAFKRVVYLVARWGATLIPTALAIVTMIGGAVLLFSGATPSRPGRMHVLHHFFPLPVMEMSHFFGSLVGACLLLVAWGLHRRLDAAYLLSVIFLASGSLFSLLKGADYEEALALGLVLVALLPCHRYFYRRASLLSEPFSLGWSLMILIVMGCSVWLGFFVYQHVDYSRDLWWQFAMTADAPRFLRAMVGATTLLLLFAIVKLMRTLRHAPGPPDVSELERAETIVGMSTETVANLALLGDKSLLFNDAGNAFIMYAVEGRSWVAMGDPIGPKEAHQQLVRRFREQCRRHEGWPVFYEIGPEFLSLYLDLGLTLIKIGEEARVFLPTYSLEGRSNRNLRYGYRRLEKEGCTFEILPSSAVPTLLPELQTISDAWLIEKNTREKGFSLGFFDPEYLSRYPIALIRQDGKIIAFANLWPGYNQEELSVDLMRFLPEAPNSTIDYLFLSLFLWGKEQGYRWFNLGMAPLAGLENRPFAPFWYRIGALIYQHGEHFYNFQGLRAYKEKFVPVWRPRYLASPGGIALPRILTNIATLISGGVKGVLGK